MEVKTKLKLAKIIALFLIVVLMFLVWAVFPYVTSVSNHPIQYYNFKSDVRMGCLTIIKRDTFMFDNSETLILENKNDGSRYHVFHYFPSHREFHQPEVEHYKFLVNEQGDFVCYKGDDEDVLKFFNTKIVQQ